MALPVPNDMDAFLKRMLQDANGDDVYNNDRALHGYLEASKFLLFTETMAKACSVEKTIGKPVEALGKTEGYIANYIPDREAYIKVTPYVDADLNDELSQLKMVALNFLYLVEGNMDAENAFVIAALRNRWATLGGLRLLLTDKTPAARRAEYIVVKEKNGGTIFEQIAAANNPGEIFAVMGTNGQLMYDRFKDDKCGIAWVLQHADAFWAASEYVFRVRGHHYKDTQKEEESYKALYTRYLDAFYEGNFVWPDKIRYAEVFRTAIHPFKMRALPMLTMHMMYYETLANSAVVRFSGSPVGNALVTTTYAGLNALRSESWFSFFATVYSEEIKFVEKATKVINDNKYNYHMSAALYGVSKLTSVEIDGNEYTMDQVKSRVSVVAAACQGLILALSTAVRENLITKFALSNAKALEKAAADAPTVTLKIRELVEMAIAAVSTAKGIPEAVRTALPSLESLKNDPA